MKDFKLLVVMTRGQAAIEYDGKTYKVWKPVERFGVYVVEIENDAVVAYRKLQYRRPPKPVVTARLASVAKPRKSRGEMMLWDRPWTKEIVLARYPRIIAHMIAESLGYFMPEVAAEALADAMNGHENWCEYLYACYDKNPIEQVRRSIALRAHHKGPMASYHQALVLTLRSAEFKINPEFASWF